MGGCFWSSYHRVKWHVLDWFIKLEGGVRKETFVSCQMGLPGTPFRESAEHRKWHLLLCLPGALPLDPRSELTTLIFLSTIRSVGPWGVGDANCVASRFGSHLRKCLMASGLNWRPEDRNAGSETHQERICQRQETELEVSYQVLGLTLPSQRSTNKLRYR